MIAPVPQARTASQAFGGVPTPYSTATPSNAYTHNDSFTNLIDQQRVQLRTAPQPPEHSGGGHLQSIDGGSSFSSGGGDAKQTLDGAFAQREEEARRAAAEQEEEARQQAAEIDRMAKRNLPDSALRVCSSGL